MVFLKEGSLVIPSFISLDWIVAWSFTELRYVCCKWVNIMKCQQIYFWSFIRAVSALIKIKILVNILLILNNIFLFLFQNDYFSLKRYHRQRLWYESRNRGGYRADIRRNQWAGERHCWKSPWQHPKDEWNRKISSGLHPTFLHLLSESMLRLKMYSNLMERKLQYEYQIRALHFFTKEVSPASVWRTSIFSFTA